MLDINYIYNVLEYIDLYGNVPTCNISLNKLHN